MRCVFYGGPADGAEEELDLHFPGAEWRVPLCPPLPLDFVEQPAELVKLQVARYRLQAYGRLVYIGMEQ